MCGILGIIGKNISAYDSSVESMLNSLSNRGPDEKGVASLSQGFLGQTRLSILDIQGGRQPMKDNKENITITFNGEIYNYIELRKELEKKGYKFSTKSDTEVILKSYLEYGENCPKYLEGMFAFAIWDGRKKQLFVARDRFGEKPFYYTLDKHNNFIFASEIKAILASEKIKGEIDPESIDAYLALMYIPPNRTVYKNIHTLSPAHFLILKNGKIEIKKYWSLVKKPLVISFEESKKEIKRLFDESIKKIMIADVEIGSFLSGGVDSTLVTAYAQKYSSFPIKTFSIGYGDHINELPFALESSKKIGTDHYTRQADSDGLEYLEKINSYFDEPHADSSDFPQYLLAKLAGSKVKVALTGDGADELFMGYGSYWRHHHLSWKAHFWEKLLPQPFKNFQKSVQIFSHTEKSKLWKNPPIYSDYLPPEINKLQLDDVEKINYYDLNFYLPGQLLTKVDRTAMMNSLETRCPFLDRKLAEFVYNIPREFKTDNKNGKIILKSILEEIMPKEFVYRRKQGFGAPVEKWLLSENYKCFIKKIFIENNAYIYQIFDKKYIIDLINVFYCGKNNNFKVYYKIWSLLNLELWFQKHK